MPISLLGPRLFEGIDMELLFRSVGYCHCLHCHGCLCQFPDNLPSVDIYSGYPSLSLLPSIGICSWLCIWLVIDHMMFFILVPCMALTLCSWGVCYYVYYKVLCERLCCVVDSHSWWDWTSIENLKYLLSPLHIFHHWFYSGWVGWVQFWIKIMRAIKPNKQL